MRGFCIREDSADVELGVFFEYGTECLVVIVTLHVMNPVGEDATQQSIPRDSRQNKDLHP